MDIKVFYLDVATLRLGFKTSRKMYWGKPNDRSAAAFAQDGVLNIFVQKKNMYLGLSTLNLTVDICDIFRIPSYRQLLVSYVIGPNETPEIEKTLQSQNIPRLQKRPSSAAPWSNSIVNRIGPEELVISQPTKNRRIDAKPPSTEPSTGYGGKPQQDNIQGTGTGGIGGGAEKNGEAGRAT